MSFYFVCPGDASVTANTVQCTQSITTMDATQVQYMSSDDRQTVIDGLTSCLVVIVVCWLCKKAIDI